MLTVDCFSARADALHVVKRREVGGSETVPFLFLSGFATRYFNRTRAEPKEVREAVHGPRDTVNPEVGGRCAQSCRRCFVLGRSYVRPPPWCRSGLCFLFRVCVW